MVKNAKYLSFLLIVLLLSGFFVTSWLSHQVAIKSIDKHILKEAPLFTGDTIYSEIQRDLFRPIIISSVMSKDTFVKDWVLNGEVNFKSLKKYLAQIKDEFNTSTSYFVSDISNKYYHPSGILKTVSIADSTDNWYFSLKNSPGYQPYQVKIDQDTADPNNLNVFVNYKVYDDDDNFLGAIGVGLSLKSVSKLIENYEERYGRTIYFTDKTGEITLQSDTFNQKTSLKERVKNNDIANQILNSSYHGASYYRGNDKLYINSRFIDELNWYLIEEQNITTSQHTLNETFVVNMLLSLLVTLGVVLIAHLTFSRYQRTLIEMARVDKLSGLLNRQAFEPIALKHMNRCNKKYSTLSLVLLDIDHFKQINDTYGHITGDEVIQHVSLLCKNLTANQGVVCRWGGEEFIILMPDTTIDQAKSLIDDIQGNLLTTTPKVTISCGITSYLPGEIFNTFLQRADSALYQAKENGRNCIKVVK